MLEKLRTSLLTSAHAKLLRLEPYTEQSEFKLAGFKFPYLNLDGTPDKEFGAEFYRYRFLQYQPSKGWGSVTALPEKPLRYIQPPNTGVHAYFPPLFSKGDWVNIAKDTSVSLIITEGELKAACLCSLEAPAIGLGGVHNWRSRRAQQELIPALDDGIKWSGRTVRIAFDSDIHTNPNVFRARSQLANVLTKRNAIVKFIDLPNADPKQKMGIDDYLFQHGAKALSTLIKDAQPDPANHALHEMNRLVAYIALTDTVVVLNDDGQGHEPGMLKTVKTFKDSAYSNYSFLDAPPPAANGSQAPARIRKTAEAWLDWPHRGTVRNIIYRPGANPLAVTEDGRFNIWSGWGVEPKAGSAQPWEDLLGMLMENAKPDEIEWLRRWFAYPLQHPGTKMIGAAVMVGRVHGTGKSILGEIMRDVYGPRNYAKIENKDLSGRSFNKWLEGRQFLLGNEISMDDRRIVTSIVKSMISDDTLVVEPKGGERYVIDDFANYYFTTNHIDAFSLEETDRRFFIHEVGADAPFSDKFYDQYHKWRAEGGAAYLFRHLLDVNLGDFNPKANPPLTDSKKKMIAFTKNDVAAWVALIREFPADYFPDDCLPPNPKNPHSDPKTGRDEGVCWATSEALRRTFDPLDHSPRITANVMTRVMSAAGFRDLNSSGNIYVSGRRGQRIWLLRCGCPTTEEVGKWYAGKTMPLIGGKANTASERSKKEVTQ